jgi:hypothetical protein
MSRAASSRESSASISVIRFANWASLLCIEGFIGIGDSAATAGRRQGPAAGGVRAAS